MKEQVKFVEDENLFPIPHSLFPNYSELFRPDLPE